MELYLLRHAIAVPRGTEEYPNDDRPLTKVGIQKMKRAARGIARLIGKVDAVISSPLIRALDTARIAGKALGHRKKIVASNALLPSSPASSIYDDLKKFKPQAKVLLVGHEPDLGLLASTLIGCEKPVVELKKGGLCCITFSEVPLGSDGKLSWLLTPKQLRAFAKK